MSAQNLSLKIAVYLSDNAFERCRSTNVKDLTSNLTEEEDNDILSNCGVDPRMLKDIIENFFSIQSWIRINVSNYEPAALTAQVGNESFDIVANTIPIGHYADAYNINSSFEWQETMTDPAVVYGRLAWRNDHTILPMVSAISYLPTFATMLLCVITWGCVEFFSALDGSRTWGYSGRRSLSTGIITLLHDLLCTLVLGTFSNLLAVAFAQRFQLPKTPPSRLDEIIHCAIAKQCTMVVAESVIKPFMGLFPAHYAAVKHLAIVGPEQNETWANFVTRSFKLEDKLGIPTYCLDIKSIHAVYSVANAGRQIVYKHLKDMQAAFRSWGYISVKHVRPEIKKALTVAFAGRENTRIFQRLMNKRYAPNITDPLSMPIGITGATIRGLVRSKKPQPLSILQLVDPFIVLLIGAAFSTLLAVPRLRNLVARSKSLLVQRSRRNKTAAEHRLLRLFCNHLAGCGVRSEIDQVTYFEFVTQRANVKKFFLNRRGYRKNAVS